MEGMSTLSDELSNDKLICTSVSIPSHECVIDGFKYDSSNLFTLCLSRLVLHTKLDI